MKGFFLRILVLLPFVLAACNKTDNPQIADEGTSEETNASVFWNESENLKHFEVIEGEGEIQLEGEATNAVGLGGRVALGKPAADGVAYAGLTYNLSGPDGSFADLSEGLGLCVAYESDFEIEIQMDLGDFVNESIDNDLPYVGLHKTLNGVETHCVPWAAFKQKHANTVDGMVAAMAIRSIRVMFVGESGATGGFNIYRVGRYED